jgi:tetratricopeptide (TPR) repeat protein
VLEAQFAETVDTQPEILAHHYTEAGLTANAVPYWQRAGQRAVERAANLEASAHLTRGLELLGTLPDTPDRASHELDLRIALGPVIRATRGYTAPEVAQNYEQARASCRHLDDIPRTSAVLAGLWELHLTAGQRPLRVCLEMAEEMLDLARRQGDAALLANGHRMLGITLFFQGDFSRARKHQERHVDLYDPDWHRSNVLQYGIDWRVTGLSYLSLILWALGYPDQALARSREAQAWARDLSHPFGLAVAGVYAIHPRFRPRPPAEPGLPAGLMC